MTQLFKLIDYPTFNAGKTRRIRALVPRELRLFSLKKKVHFLAYTLVVYPVVLLLEF